MLISPAYAQAAGGAQGGSGLEAFIPLVLIFVVFYFLLIRPQSKKMKAHKEMLTAIKRGDRVVTNGGIIALVTKVIDDATLQLEIAEGVKVKVKRDMIASVEGKTEPVAARKKGKDEDEASGDAADEGGTAATEDSPADAAKSADAGARLKGLFSGKKG